MRFLRSTLRLCLATSLGLTVAATAAVASTRAETCDRDCLKGLGDTVLASMAAHDPAQAPVAPIYAATENSVPGALSMMTLWRTVSSVDEPYYVIDPTSQQLFLIATVSEGGVDSLLYGRLKADQGKVSEIELFVNRSRAQGGFQFEAHGPAKLPTAWTRPLGDVRRASREELLLAGRSIFDTSIDSPPAATSCELIENGKTVEEHPEVLDAISGDDQASSRQRQNDNGTVAVPCPSPPDRPTDPQARVSIIDEEQGVVVSMAVVHGVTAPYVVTDPTESAYVPEQMFAPYSAFMRQQIANKRNDAPYIHEMKASGAVSQLVRVFDGQIQGVQLMVNLGAPGGRSPWTEPPVAP